MNENSIITYVDYGLIYFDINEIMKKRGISQTQLVKRTGLHNQIIERYMNGSITRYDKEVLAKICYVLSCSLNDIMYYISPKDYKQN